MLTKKDFITLADAIKSTKPSIEDYSVVFSKWSAMQSALAQWAATQNPNFNRARFDAACGK